MPNWDAGQYLKFEAERTRPARDLAAAVLLHPHTVLDAGCGPGNSTAVLAERWPDAALTGLDSSPDMLRKAGEILPSVAFVQRDLREDLSDLGPFDLVYSNAVLQWMPDPEETVLRLFSLVAPGGALAVQVPCSKPQQDYGPRLESREVHTALQQTAQEPPYAAYVSDTARLWEMAGERMEALLLDKTDRLEIWETAYLHRLNGYEGLLDWYRGTGLRPYLEALPDALRHPFEQEVLDKLQKRYPVGRDGVLHFWFRRFFSVAYKLK